MPGYTHLQRAIAGDGRPPPARLGRDARARPRALRGAPTRRRRRRRSAPARSPGSTLPLPPPAGEQMRNSLDAVADRDFALDYLYACAVLVHAPVADRRGARPLVDERVRLRASCPESRRDGLVDDAAEAEPRRRRARARQGRDDDRPADRPARRREGPAARVRPRPAGGQAAGVRRAPRRAARARRARRARRRARARPRAPRRRMRRSAAARDGRGRAARRRRRRRSAMRTSRSRRRCAPGRSSRLRRRSRALRRVPLPPYAGAVAAARARLQM